MASLSKKRRTKRRRLYREQNGLCYYCKCTMELQVTKQRVAKGGLDDDVATLEHLDDRFNDKRGTFHHVKRVVLACNKCNHEKGKKSEKEQGIEELRRRAKSGKR